MSPIPQLSSAIITNYIPPNGVSSGKPNEPRCPVCGQGPASMADRAVSLGQVGGSDNGVSLLQTRQMIAAGNQASLSLDEGSQEDLNSNDSEVIRFLLNRLAPVSLNAPNPDSATAVRRGLDSPNSRASVQGQINTSYGQIQASQKGIESAAAATSDGISRRQEDKGDAAPLNSLLLNGNAFKKEI